MTDLPSTKALQAELDRVNSRRSWRHALRSTLYSLLAVAAVSVLVAVLFLPVLQIYGTSMTPTLREGEIVLAVKSSDFSVGDLAAFYYNNRILVKRVVGLPGDWMDIGADGTVYRNGEPLSEPYLSEKAPGEWDIELPCQVPENRFFVLGDHRAVSVDSRSSVIGYVSEEQLVGRIIFRVFPFRSLGRVR